MWGRARLQRGDCVLDQVAVFDHTRPGVERRHRGDGGGGGGGERDGA